MLERPPEAGKDCLKLQFFLKVRFENLDFFVSFLHSFSISILPHHLSLHQDCVSLCVGSCRRPVFPLKIIASCCGGVLNSAQPETECLVLTDLKETQKYQVPLEFFGRLRDTEVKKPLLLAWEGCRRLGVPSKETKPGSCFYGIGIALKTEWTSHCVRRGSGGSLACA